MVRFETGPWHTVYISYSFGLMVASLLVVIGSMRGADRLYRKRSLVLLLAFIPPAMVEFLHSLHLLPPLRVDLTPALFIISGLIIAYGLYRYRMLDVRPIARGEVVEQMTDAFLVVAPDGKLVDHNQAAEGLLLPLERDAVGGGMTEVLPFGKDLMGIIAGGGTVGDVEVHGDGARYFEARVVPIAMKDQDIAHVVLLRDMTERRGMEEELRTANHRLGLMSTLTRHDLMNKLTAINGFSVLARYTQDPEKARTYLTRLKHETSSATELIMMSREMESLGMTPSSWFAVDDLFRKAGALVSGDGIEVRSAVTGVSVLADPLVDKVFYNLLDNSLRHGQRVRTIALDHQEDDRGLVIVYSDDGVGVPPENKERIFDRGFGSNSGLGMFLVREILGITGITIEENRTEGARFEMRVPPGRYRIGP